MQRGSPWQEQPAIEMQHTQMSPTTKRADQMSNNLQLQSTENGTWLKNKLTYMQLEFV